MFPLSSFWLESVLTLLVIIVKFALVIQDRSKAKVGERFEKLDACCFTMESEENDSTDEKEDEEPLNFLFFFCDDL